MERNVLEWRFDPASDARLPWVHGYDEQVIVFCSEGYTSSLAAAALQDLGLAGATDIAGGFVAWAADGLPACPPCGPPAPGSVTGYGRASGAAVIRYGRVGRGRLGSPLRAVGRAGSPASGPSGRGRPVTG